MSRQDTSVALDLGRMGGRSIWEARHLPGTCHQTMQLIFRALATVGIQEYVRHLLFGLLFTAFPAHYLWTYQGPVPPPVYLLIVGNTVLYPFARFGYLAVVDYIVGGNVFIWNTWIFLAFKLMTMLACWLLAIFIAAVVVIVLTAQQIWRNRRPTRH